jgi:hypothetical protein
MSQDLPILQLGLVVQDEDGKTEPALQMQIFPAVWPVLLEAMEWLRQHQDQEFVRVTLYGTQERGVHIDLNRQMLTNLVAEIQGFRFQTPLQ